MTDQTIRVLEQAVGIAKQRIEILEADKRKLLSDLEIRRDLYLETKQSEEFWRGECASEERKTSTSIILMLVVCIFAAAAIAKAILVCQ